MKMNHAVVSRRMLALFMIAMLVTTVRAQRFMGQAFPTEGTNEAGISIVLEGPEARSRFSLTDDYDAILWEADLTVDLTAEMVEIHRFGYEYAGRFDVGNGGQLSIAVKGWFDGDKALIPSGPDRFTIDSFRLDEFEVTGTYRNGDVLTEIDVGLPVEASVKRDSLSLDFSRYPSRLEIDESKRTILNYHFRNNIELEPALSLTNIRIASWINEGELLPSGVILNPLPGDANRDGIFNSSDLVQVFAAGEYEDGVLENSVWETGDWTGDREFDSGDLVAAFITGTYVAGAAVQVPEPTGTATFMMALLLCADLMRWRGKFARPK